MGKTCFDCEKKIHMMYADAPEIIKSRIDIPLGFTDSDYLCSKCVKNG